MGAGLGTCCTLRDHVDNYGLPLSTNRPSFSNSSATGSSDLGFGDYLVFGPAFADAQTERRLVVASKDQLRTYRFPRDPIVSQLEHNIHFQEDEILTAVCFWDNLSRYLLGAFVIRTYQSDNKSDTNGKSNGKNGIHTEGNGITDSSGYRERIRIRMWECSNELRVIKEIEGPRAMVTCLNAHPTLLFAGDAVGRVSVWKKQEHCSLLGNFLIHPGGVLAMEVDYSHLYTTGSKDKSFAVWKLDTMELLHRVYVHDGSLTVTKERRASGYADGSLSGRSSKINPDIMCLQPMCINERSSEMEPLCINHRKHPGVVPMLCINGRDEQNFTSCLASSNEVDVETGNRFIHTPRGTVRILGIRRDRSLGNIRNSTTEMPEIGVNVVPNTVRFKKISCICRPFTRWQVQRKRGGSSACGLLYVACENEHGNGCIMEYNMRSQEYVRSVIGHDGPIVTLIFGPYDNGPLFSGGDDGLIKVWDISTLRVLKILDGESSIKAMAVQQQQSIFSLTQDGILKIWTLS